MLSMHVYYMECLRVAMTLQNLTFNQTYLMVEVNGSYINQSDPGQMNGSLDTTLEDATWQTFFMISNRFIVPTICTFGIVGNILTLIILARKRLKSSVDGTERSVHIGLSALAGSDLLCCACLLPSGFMSNESGVFSRLTFELLYLSYSSAFINTFVLTSTWLTVVMATSRYLAICHPFRARHLIGIRGTRVSIILVFFGSALFNAPRFFTDKIERVQCHVTSDFDHLYIKSEGFFKKHQQTLDIYNYIYFSLGVFLPLATLAVCNFRLVKALRESSKLRRRFRVKAEHLDANHRATSILVTIVVMYIVLVSPAEIFLFFKSYYMKNLSHVLIRVLQAGSQITNVLQTLNFSCNFVLYFILNVHFRQGMCDLLKEYCPCWFKKEAGANSTFIQVPLQENNKTVQTNV